MNALSKLARPEYKLVIFKRVVDVIIYDGCIFDPYTFPYPLSNFSRRACYLATYEWQGQVYIDFVYATKRESRSLDKQRTKFGNVPTSFVCKSNPRMPNVMNYRSKPATGERAQPIFTPPQRNQNLTAYLWDRAKRQIGLSDRRIYLNLPFADRYYFIKSIIRSAMLECVRGICTDSE